MDFSQHILENFLETTLIQSSFSKIGSITSWFGSLIDLSRSSVPATEGLLERKRIQEALQRSSSAYAVTFIIGRHGTGKSIAAAFFCKDHTISAWHSVTSADRDWGIFASHLEAAVSCERAAKSQRIPECRSADPEPDEIDAFISELFKSKDVASLIVIDDLHYLFDEQWFESLIAALIAHLPYSTHLFLIARSLPNSPIWRFRSKQVMNVIDEEILYFLSDETIEFYRSQNLSEAEALTDHLVSFGHPGKLGELVIQRSNRSRPINHSSINSMVSEAVHFTNG